jgi:hypothetical protein
MAQRSVPTLGLVRTFVPLAGSGRLAYAPAAQKALFDSSRPALLGSLYVGPVALALAVAALLEPRRRRVAVVLAGVVVLAALVALGPHSPVHGIMVRWVPGAAHFRFPSKVTVALGFASALLAGLGLAAVRSHAASRRVAGALAAGGALVLASGAALRGPALRWAIAWGLLLDRPGAEGTPWSRPCGCWPGRRCAPSPGRYCCGPVARRVAPESRLSSRPACCSSRARRCLRIGPS